jgi:hypothetical protein
VTYTVEVDEPKRDEFYKIVAKNFKKDFDTPTAKEALMAAIADADFPDDLEMVKVSRTARVTLPKVSSSG